MVRLLALNIKAKIQVLGTRARKIDIKWMKIKVVMESISNSTIFNLNKSESTIQWTLKGKDCLNKSRSNRCKNIQINACNLNKLFKELFVKIQVMAQLIPSAKTSTPIVTNSEKK